MDISFYAGQSIQQEFPHPKGIFKSFPLVRMEAKVVAPQQAAGAS
jgi:hypothetical protein